MIRKILITGATGFVGKNFLDLIKKKKYKILAISRKNQKKNKNIVWLKSDFGKVNSKNLKKIIKFGPEVIIHMGWQDIPNFDNKTCALNLNKSKQFLRKLIHLKSLKKIIITGSCLEYLNKKGIISENQKLDKINFMPKSKIDLQVFSKKLCFINKKKFFWLRPFYIYGPYQRKDSLIPYLVRKISNNSDVELASPFKNIDYIYVQDVVKIIELFVRKNIKEGIYNIGSGIKTSVIEVHDKLQLKIKKRYLPNKYSRTDYFISNNLKLNKIIGKYKFINIDKGLNKYLLWLKKSNFF